jgi:valacyclovir hydrolase
MHTIICDNGIRIAYYHIPGPLPAVVFIHGFTGTGQAHFQHEIPLFVGKHAVYAPDLRGYGASAPPLREFGVDFYQRDAADVAAFIRSLNIGAVHLVGFSDGAEIALLVAATHPELVISATVWGVCGQISPEMVARVRHWLPVSAWGPDRADWKAEIVALHGIEQFAPIIEGWVAAAEAIAARGGDIVHDVAHLITCPVIVIHGANDVGNPIPVVTALCAKIPFARLIILPDVGHSVQDEAPAALHDILRQYMGFASLA